MGEAMDASFALNLFLDGFGIDRPTQKGQPPPLADEVMDCLYPYDRSSEGFLRAIDGGWLPVDLLDEIPCTFVNGCVACEIRDYRDCEYSDTMPLDGMRRWAPKLKVVVLRPGMENLVRDVNSMADESWSYSDMLELESRILKAVRPSLDLHPSRAVARKAHVSFHDKWKLNSGCRATRRYRTHFAAVLSRRLRAASRKLAIQSADYVGSKTVIPSDMDTGRGSSASLRQENKSSENVGSESWNATQPAVGTGKGRPGNEGLGFTPAAGWLPPPDQEQAGVSVHRTFQEIGISVPEGMHGAMVPPTPLRQMSDSPSLSTPSTPVTTGNSGLDTSGIAIGDSGLDTTGLVRSASLLGKRESRDALGIRSEKRMKHEPVKGEKVQLPNKAHHKAEGKHSKDPQGNEKHQSSQHLTTEKLHSVVPQRMASISSQYVKQEEVSMHDGYLSNQSDVKVCPDENQEHTDCAGVQEEYLEKLETGEGVEQHAAVSQSEYLEDLKRLTEADPRVKHQVIKGLLSRGGQSQQFVSHSQQVDGKPERSEVKSETMQMNDDSTNFDDFCTRLQQGGLKWGQKADAQAIMPGGGHVPPTQISNAAASPLILNPNPILGPQVSSSVSVNQIAEKPFVDASSSNLLGVGSLEQASHFQNMQQAVRARIGAVSKPSVSNSGNASPVGSPKNPGSPCPAAGPLEQSTSGPGTKDSVSTLALLAVIRSHNLHTKKKKVEEVFPISNAVPPWHSLLVALADAPDEPKELPGSRRMATSLVGGSVNSRKNRTMVFRRMESVFPGHSPSVHYSRIRLVISGRSKDLMVEVSLQFGDEHDEESPNLSAQHQGFSSAPTTGFTKQVFLGEYSLHKADLIASQYTSLVTKDGYELVEDEIYVAARSVASNARPMPAGATSLGSFTGPVSSPRSTLGMAAMGGNMQPSSPGSFSRMPPPGGAGIRQLLGNDLGGSAVALQKQPQMDGTSQLVQQHHSLVQPQQLQRSTVPMSANQLAAQMAGPTHNQQQLNSSIVGHSAAHLQQYQFLQHQQQHQQHQQQQKHQQQQHQQAQMLQHRKHVLYSGAMGMGAMNGMAGTSGGAPAGMGNLVGLNGMNGMSGMTSMNPMTGSFMGLSGLTNMPCMSSLGPNPVGNLMAQQLRPGAVPSPQTLSAAAKNRIIAAQRARTGNVGAGQPPRTPLDNMSPLGPSQLQGGSRVTMMAQPIARGGIAPVQRTAGTGIASPKNNPTMASVSGQPFGMNSASNPQQLGTQQHLGGSQPLNSSLNGGVLGSFVGGPQSPQLNSQSLTSVTGLTSSAIDVQNANRANSLMTAVGRGRRPLSTVQMGQPTQ